jgi:methionyl aminopeptidase
MQTIAQKAGFDVLKKYTGHGIGKSLHHPPTIPAHGQPHLGTQLKKGMVICLEAQLVTGSDKVVIDKDGWTVRTADKGNTAMFEYMVVVQDKKPIILTPTLDWPIVV